MHAGEMENSICSMLASILQILVPIRNIRHMGPLEALTRFIGIQYWFPLVSVKVPKNIYRLSYGHAR